MLKKIEESDFEKEVMKNSKTVLVDFFATWCGPCQMLMPVLEKISDERDDLNIIEIDVDTAQNLSIKYDITAVPTMIIFKDGVEVKRLEGFYTKDELESEIKEYI